MNNNLYYLILGLIFLILVIRNYPNFKTNMNIIKGKIDLEEKEDESIRGQIFFAYREIIYYYIGIIGTLFFLLMGLSVF